VILGVDEEVDRGGGRGGGGVVPQVEGVVVEVDRVWIMRWRGWRWWMARYPYKYI
jgi:hypothetical protein